MKLSALEQRLVDAIAGFEIVDAHEHLPPEEDYLAFKYCGVNFFAGYVRHDLVSAGMSREFMSHMRDPGYRSPERWWPEIAPYWQHARHTSYSRAARITARDLYGIDEINDQTIGDLSEKIIADNQPGIYQRILRDKCNVRVGITCQPPADLQDDTLLRPMAQLEPERHWTMDGIEAYGATWNNEIQSFEDLVAVDSRRLAHLKTQGAVGFKAHSNLRSEPSPNDARRAFAELCDRGSIENPAPLADHLFHQALKTAGELDLPVALHSGIWNDFRTDAPTWMIPWAMRHTETRFDLFHLGIPYARQAAVIGKNFPNVYLNLTWCYVISTDITLQMIGELIDLVPVNKIIAFGGDYRCCVQKVYGHLVMARETVARALARHVTNHSFPEDRAIEIGRMWFHDNAAAFYKV